MIKRIAVIMAVVICFSLVFPASAATGSIGFGGEIRVGLTTRLSNVGSITFHNPVIYIGFQSPLGFRPEARIVSPGRNIVAAADSAFYFSVGHFMSFTDAGHHAAHLRGRGFNAVPAVRGVGQWTVYVGDYPSEAAALADMSVLGGVPAPANNRRIVITENNINVAIFDSPYHFPQFFAGGEPVDLGTHSYRGRIELARIGGQNLTAINVIDVEEYLWSVVPSEMPPSWPLHALKAQAIACRTYTATRRGVHAEQGFDICDGEHCQVYNGSGVETVATNAAVNATHGIKIWHAGNLIEATYFGSSGGFTDNSENVWQNASPYLRGIADTHEREPRVWNRTITLADLDRALAARPPGSMPIGAATDMRIGRTENNRVQELIIVGTAGSLTLTREEIRNFFAPLPGGRLYSRNFTIVGAGFNPTALTSNVHIVGANSFAVPQNITSFHVRVTTDIVLPAAAAGDVITVRSAYGHQGYSTHIHGPAPHGTFVLNGLGHGHGVGMSQQGARGMAEAGFTFEQILRHFYRGVEVRR